MSERLLRTYQREVTRRAEERIMEQRERDPHFAKMSIQAVERGKSQRRASLRRRFLAAGRPRLRAGRGFGVQ